MKGCTHRPQTAFCCGRWITYLCLLAVLGCGSARPELPANSGPAAAACEFDPATAVTLRGRVTWEGDIPSVPPFKVGSYSVPGDIVRQSLTRENPNTPAIDRRTRAVANAVVFLRGVDPRKAKPWKHPPVRVEQAGLRLRVRQGDVDSHCGFVRRGDAVEMVSREAVFHSLHAGGAAFFTLPFPDPDQPLSRTLNKKGIVELSSAAGYYWMRAYLFVGDHPYYARTDARGRFALEQVPPGRYEVICWMPSWREARHDLDPETAVVSRVVFGPPAEPAQTITLGQGEAPVVRFVLSKDSFGR